jgi:small-conductance mechanosensitive channel
MFADLNVDVWIGPLVWTLAIVLFSWGSGRILRALVNWRVKRPSSASRTVWAEQVGQLLARRIPLWSVLIGLWVASGHWPLTAEARVVVGSILFVLGASSVTLTAAAVATQIIDSYSAVIAPALPVNSLTRNVAWAFVATLGLLVILNGLGLSIAPMLAALGVGGLAVALALQEPLANFFAGVFIMLAGQIRVGNYIKLDSGYEGYVADVSWRSTRLHMLPNNLVLVPNAKLAQAIVVNHHLPSPELAVLVEVGVDYASDLKRVERVVMEVGREVMAEVPGAVPDFQPFLRYHTYGESSIDFTVILRAKQFVDQYLVKHEFIKRLHERFDEEGIVIPFPIRTIVNREPSDDRAPIERMAGAA